MPRRRPSPIHSITALWLGLLAVLLPLSASEGSAAAQGVNAAAGSGAQFVPVDPVRIADTRRPDIGPFGTVTPDRPLQLSVTGRANLPTGTITAVAVNVTTVNAASVGYVTAWPTGGPQPEVSNVNVNELGYPVPNFAIVPVSGSGGFSLYTSMPTDLVVDLAGVYVATGGTSAAGRTLAVTPSRALDTRTGGRPAAGQTVGVSIAGRYGVPSNADAAVVTLTATDAAASGYVTAWPAGIARPEVSNLNVPAAGRTVANLAIVPLGDGGAIRLFTEAGAHLLVDVVGYVTGSAASSSSAGLFVAVSPQRQLDTRQPGSRGVLLGGYRADVQLTPPSGLSAGQIGLVAANLTLTGTSGGLFLTAYPAQTDRPNTSNVNADTAQQSIAAFGLVPVGNGARISLRPSARTHAIVDVAGFFLGSPAAPDMAIAPQAPTAQGSMPIGAFDAAIAGFLIEQGLAGASVAVAKDGRVVYARSYGVADAATGEAMRVEHHFRIASISKVMTAVAVERLAAAGTLGLDRKVWPLLDKTVPLPAGADARYRNITVGQLLGHVSGVPATPDPYFDDSVEGVAAFGLAGPTSCQAAARWTVGRPLSWDPGTHYSYANVNFCLLGLVIEAVTGRPWNDVVRDLVQLPRDVADMYLGRTYERGALDVAHPTPALAAKGGGWFMESIGGAGAWLGTAVDVVKVLDGLDPAKPGADLLTSAQLAQMRARPTTDRGDDLTWYGLGLLSYRQGQAYGHTGALEGARSMAVHEANGLTWAIMTNGKFDDHQDEFLALMDTALALVPIESWPAYDLARDLP